MPLFTSYVIVKCIINAINARLLALFQITRWLLPLWAMAAIFGTENNECSQDDYIAPVFAVTDDSGVSNKTACYVH